MLRMMDLVTSLVRMYFYRTLQYGKYFITAFKNYSQLLKNRHISCSCLNKFYNEG